MKILLLSVITTILVINESSFVAQARPRDVVEAELATAVVGDRLIEFDEGSRRRLLPLP